MMKFDTNLIAGIVTYLENKESELSHLTSRFNAHMTFNVMSTLKGILLSGDLEEANDLLDRYARLLRKMLVTGSIQTTLEAEMETIKDFLEIERIRMDHTFSYSISLPEEIKEQNIPKSVIISLVENAVKHGMRYSNINGFMGKGFIRIDCPDNKRMTIRVQNNAPLNNRKGDTGFGLSLTQELINHFNRVMGSELKMTYSEEKIGIDEIMVQSIITLC